MSHKKGFILYIIVLMMLAPLALQAQRNEHRVFLWDISESLIANGMWEPLKKSLKDAIQAIPSDPSNKISLIPFYGQVVDPLTVYATDEGKKQLINAINNRGDKPKPIGSCKTNIVAALQKYHELTSPDYINYMFLFTDGKNEIGSLRDELQAWNRKNENIQSYGFYVLVDTDADISEVREAEGNQNNFWVVPDANVTIKTVRTPNKITINIQDTDTIQIALNGDYKNLKNALVFSSDDPYYAMEIDDQHNDGSITAKLSKKVGDNEIPEEYDVVVNSSLQGTDKYEFILPKQFIIHCINKPERTVKIRIK